LGEGLGRVAWLELVDLCTPLLEQARQRWAGQPKVRVVEGDACRYRPGMPPDAVYFSYALSMIPDWTTAVDNALAMLPGDGLLGVADFYVSRPHPAPQRVRHGAFTRTFWPLWFGHDGVHPSPDHLPYLESRLDLLKLHEGRARVPYLPGMRVPYYVLLGRKRP
jgi:S-adenosylmethionine-diacylgycerolhomoserine-N-methlytransferase